MDLRKHLRCLFLELCLIGTSSKWGSNSFGDVRCHYHLSLPTTQSGKLGKIQFLASALVHLRFFIQTTQPGLLATIKNECVYIDQGSSEK